jgi:lipoprotein NlpI
MFGRVARAIVGMVVPTAAMMLVWPAFAEPTADWKCNAITDVPLDERIAACTAVIDSGRFGRPSLIRAYFNRAGAYNKKTEFDRAVADYSALMEFHPGNIFVYNFRAYSYFQLGELDRAIADYDRAIELNQRSRYAYLSRGVAYYRKEDYDHAIADYTQALQLGHQDPVISADRKAQSKGQDGDPIPPPVDGQAPGLGLADGHAFYVRGAAYFGKGDLERAIADYDQAIRLNPTDKRALAYRALAYKIKGKLDGAIRDYDRIAQLDPRDARAYRARAMVYWQGGSFSQSLNDLDQAVWLDPKNPYSALWREIVASRSGQPSQLAEAAAQLDMTKWPAPIVNLFLGSATSEQVLGAADDSDPKKREAQMCETNFYSAELALQRGAKDDAQRLFDRAAADCPKTFVERHAANVELAALHANR